jgi:hypothetical protein
MKQLYPIHSTSNLSFLENYACVAPSNSDILHYGSMLRDPDRTSFESDMQREMSNLLQTDTVELSHKSTVPNGLCGGFATKDFLTGPS